MKTITWFSIFIIFSVLLTGCMDVEDLIGQKNPPKIEPYQQAVNEVPVQIEPVPEDNDDSGVNDLFSDKEVTPPIMPN